MRGDRESKGNTLKFVQGGEEEAKELCRGCGLKKKPVDYDDID